MGGGQSLRGQGWGPEPSAGFALVGQASSNSGGGDARLGEPGHGVEAAAQHLRGSNAVTTLTKC